LPAAPLPPSSTFATLVVAESDGVDRLLGADAPPVLLVRLPLNVVTWSGYPLSAFGSLGAPPSRPLPPWVDISCPGRQSWGRPTPRRVKRPLIRGD
jgi:hypothetical protein